MTETKKPAIGKLSAKVRRGRVYTDRSNLNAAAWVDFDQPKKPAPWISYVIGSIL